MREIKKGDEADFQRCCMVGSGYIYNDFSPNASDGNILHVAACETLERANTNVRKYYVTELSAATAWLDSHRPNRWKPCAVCTP